MPITPDQARARAAEAAKGVAKRAMSRVRSYLAKVEQASDAGQTEPYRVPTQKFRDGLRNDAATIAAMKAAFLECGWQAEWETPDGLGRGSFTWILTTPPRGES